MFSSQIPSRNPPPVSPTHGNPGGCSTLLAGIPAKDLEHLAQVLRTLDDAPEEQFGTILADLIPDSHLTPPPGGCLARRSQIWRDIGEGWAANLLAKGLQIPFLSTPPQQRAMPPELHLSPEEMTAGDDEITSMIAKQAIEPVPVEEIINPRHRTFYHQMFLVEKRRTTPTAPQEYRPCSNLKPLNAFVEDQHFKMEDIRDLFKMLDPAAHACSVDFKDAFFGVPIAPFHRDLLRFRWRGTHYRFRAMGFGYKLAPRCYVKLWRPIVKLFRSMGIRMMMYIDDVIVLGRDARECARNTATVITVVQSLGAILKKSKCELTPSTNFEFLGKVLDTQNMTVSLPHRKVKELKKLARRLFNSKILTPTTAP